MSLTLNMVGGGGGGISPNDALLVVYTPIGSSVTITNGSTTKSLDSSKSHTSSADSSVAVYVFSIPQSQFGTWTVTATRGGDTKTKTITINAIMQYVLKLVYDFYLYNRGTYGVAWEGVAKRMNTSGTSTTRKPTITEHDDYFTWYINGASGVYQTKESIDLTEYTTIRIEASDVSSAKPELIVYDNGTYWANHAGGTIKLANGSLALDISSVDKAYYIGIAGSYASGSVSVNIHSIMLES